MRNVLVEQIGSPGAWVAGIRTVDRRTGRRVALWRTVLLALARVAAEAAGKASRGTPPPAAERDRRRNELQAIYERFADDRDARDAALTEHFREHPNPVTTTLAGPLVSAVAFSVLNRRLRRRLAPTVLVRRRR